MFQAVIVAVILYGMESYSQLNKRQEEEIESIHRAALIDILELSKFVNYRAALAELGLMTMIDRIKLQKLVYVNGLHKRSATIVKNHLDYEAETTPSFGLRKEIAELCKEFKIPDVNTTYILKEDLVRAVKTAAYRSVWESSLHSKKVLARWEPRETEGWNKPWYMAWSKLEGKLMLAFRLGELEFKTNRRGESEKLYGGVHCWYGQCGGLDEISHVSRCEGYNARPVEVDDGDPRNLVNYLIQLNSERIRKWGQPLLFTRGF